MQSLARGGRLNDCKRLSAERRKVKFLSSFFNKKSQALRSFFAKKGQGFCGFFKDKKENWDEVRE
jgi:hypothetical protein